MRVDQGALEIGLHAGQPLGRLVCQQQRGDEGHDRAGRFLRDGGTIAGIGDDAGDREPGEDLGDRCHPLRDARDAVCPRLGEVDEHADLVGELLLHREGLDDGDALRRLLHCADQPRIDLDGLARRPPQPPHQVVDRKHDGRADHQCDHRQDRILVDHDAEQCDQGHRVARDRGQRHRQDVADAGDVLVDPRRELPRAGGGVEADTEAHQLVDDAALVARDEIVADLGQKHGLAVRGEPADHEGDDDGAADDPDQVVALFREQQIDDIAHDVGSERGRRGEGH